MCAGFTYPSEWVKGQLLDLKRYSDGTFTAVLLGEDPAYRPKVEFPSAFEAQAFTSEWYQREAGR